MSTVSQLSSVDSELQCSLDFFAKIDIKALTEQERRVSNARQVRALGIEYPPVTQGSCFRLVLSSFRW
jgi:hypothetical protein